MEMFLCLYPCVCCPYMVLLKALQQYETPAWGHSEASSAF